MPRQWIAGRVVQLRAERNNLEHSPQTEPRTATPPGEIKALAEALGGIVNVLATATPPERAAVYQELGVKG